MHHQLRWTVQKIAQRLALIEPLVYRRRQPLAPFRLLRLSGPLDAPPVGLEVDDSGWETVGPEGYWGARGLNFVLRTAFGVPADWESDLPVALFLPLGIAGDFSHPEALAYLDGEPYAACDRHHQEFLLPEHCRDGRDHLLALHGWAGGSFGDGSPQLLMRPCAVVQIDAPTREFVAAARAALGVARTLGADDPARGRLLDALDAAFRILDTREPFGDAFYASVGVAAEALRAGVAAAGAPLDVTLTAVGHAHIDVAWLWTLGQTRRKAGRTFHTVIRLMEQFPEYHFTQSQAQLYEFVRQDYPALFAAIRQRVAEGRWEVIGGTWVENDCNITGPESLARQFLLGRAFYREHFGPDADSPVLWLPDVFGYAWSLPQLIRQAGMEYFFTIKLGWNQYNRLPYDSFWWQGLDGTKVLTHFSTTPEAGSVYASTYNAAATPEQVIGTWTNLQQKDEQRSLLMAYGYGDGGGGPTREMIENVRAMAALPGAPRVQAGRAGDFFRRLEAESGDRLPTWNGELYLELHRGTYTTQSRNKRANRKSEFLLHDAEFAAALASVLDPAYAYPVETFRRAWELVCLNQFHDIIPGSSIGEVYVESQQQYGEVRRMAEEARDAALDVIGAKVGGDLLLVNPTGFTRDDPVFVPADLFSGQGLRRADGTPVLVQPAEGGAWILPGDLLPYSATPVVVTERPSPQTPLPQGEGLRDHVAPPLYEGEGAEGVRVTPSLLENACLRVEFNAAGDITRIYDRANDREVIPPGALANQFQAFEDRPLNWDAWDIDVFYDDRMWLADPAAAIRVVEAGPLRATLEIRRRILHSDIVQRVSLACNNACLDFDTHIDWQECHVLLKVAFPVDVLSPQATYEIQWGNVQRPTHRNTRWDWARFETCAQKWVDLSEGGYGVSLINDCKYGHDIRDNVIRLSLLRAPTEPDPAADRGQHRFAYRLLPHAGGWDERTVAAAYAFNDPVLVYKSGGGTPVALPALLAADRPNAVIETIKRAEDGNGLIVRLYESQRQRGSVTLTAGFPLAGARRTNLLEEDGEALAAEGDRVRLFLRPYEIATLRLLPA